MTGRSWETPRAATLATSSEVANGYIRGTLEHAATAWLPATTETNVEILEREVGALPSTSIPGIYTTHHFPLGISPA